jgi:hypothetical protein
VPYTPRPQSPIGWVRLGVSLVALAVFVIGSTKVDSDPRLGYGLMVVGLIVNTPMVLLNYRAARRGRDLPPPNRRAS